MRPVLSIPSPCTPCNAEPGSRLVTSYVCADAPALKRTVAATVAQRASLLVMTLPPDFFISGEYSSAALVWQMKLEGVLRHRCHKNEMPTAAAPNLARILQKIQRLVICRTPAVP